MTDPILALIEEGMRRYGTLAAFAQAVGYSRPALSRRRNGSYGKDTRDLDDAIRAAVNLRECPHFSRPIAIRDCDAQRTKPMPRSNADALRHWSACRSCPHGGAA